MQDPSFLSHFPRFLDLTATGGLGILAPVFLILFLGEMGIPFFGAFQGLLFYAGYQLTLGKTEVLPLLVIIQSARQVGSACVYWLARALGSPFLQRWQRFPHLPQKQLKPSTLKLHLPPPLAVAAGRLAPGLLVPTSLVSGALKVHYAAFALGVFLSAIIWDGTFLGIGAVFGRQLGQYRFAVDFLYPLLILATIVVLVVGLGRFVLRAVRR